MKKILYTLALVAALTACSGTVKYNISGVNAPDGAQIHLLDMLSGEEIASADVTDGSFSFSGKTEKNALLAVAQEGGNWQTLLYADGTPLVINMEDNSVTGSPLNEKLTSLDLEASTVFTEALRAINNIQALPEDEQEAAYQEQLDKVEACYKGILHEDGILPAAFMDTLYQMIDPEEIDSVLAENKALANHPFAKKAINRYAERKAKMEEADAAKKAFIGKEFSDLEEADAAGVMHKLSEYVGTGKWVLVDFWASWCGPCKGEMPNVVEAYKKYHAAGFDIVGLSFDNDKDAWVAAIKDWEMPWIHLSDLQGWQSVAASTYRVNSIPDNLLIDPSGVIVARGLRGSALADKLAEVLGQ